MDIKATFTAIRMVLVVLFPSDLFVLLSDLWRAIFKLEEILDEENMCGCWD